VKQGKPCAAGSENPVRLAAGYREDLRCLPMEESLVWMSSESDHAAAESIRFPEMTRNMLRWKVLKELGSVPLLPPQNDPACQGEMLISLIV
jgi:hypothetical protein